MADSPAARLETFSNSHPGRTYLIRHDQPEFTSRCPVTGQPDFGTIILEYVPNALCVELKSLKTYYQSYRERGIFYEAVTNQIADDMFALLAPRYLKVTSTWRPRGGMNSIITVELGERPAGVGAAPA
jgi:7-cyano-7-deazaguanine reductase